MIIGNSNLSENIVGTNPNLLDNWYFVGGGSQQGNGIFPINQRGQTSYSPDQRVNTIDRWDAVRGQTFTLTANGLQTQPVSGYTDTWKFQQEIKSHSNYIGKTLTLSCLFTNSTDTNFRIGIVGGSSSSDRKFSDKTGSMSSGLVSTTFTLPNSITELMAVILGTSGNTSTSVVVTVQAIKLEFGDTQTLAHQEKGVWVLNEIPDYATELTKCQRYFQVFKTQSLRPTYKNDFRPVMYKDPTLSTLTIDGTTYYTATANV